MECVFVDGMAFLFNGYSMANVAEIASVSFGRGTTIWPSGGPQVYFKDVSFLDFLSTLEVCVNE
jgi:hypothetical protein